MHEDGDSPVPGPVSYTHLDVYKRQVWSLWSCQKDEAYFDVLVPADGLTFSPVEGGAVMHYRLPADEEVYGIRVRYKDAFGRDMIRTGSYACDSLLITGFNEARKGVKAFVTLCNKMCIRDSIIPLMHELDLPFQ